MQGPYAIGISVFIGLLILTGLEYLLAQMGGLFFPLMAIGLFKAVLILEYYMHVSRLWKPEAEGGA